MSFKSNDDLRLKGAGGPRVQIMENEFECLADTEDRDLHFAEEFVKKILFLAEIIVISVSRFACR